MLDMLTWLKGFQWGDQKCCTVTQDLSALLFVKPSATDVHKHLSKVM